MNYCPNGNTCYCPDRHHKVLTITPEQVEFKELAIGDHCFHNNTFYKKTGDRLSDIISTIDYTVVREREFTGNALVNIVLEK